MKTVRVGIIGCSGVGQRHAEHLLKTPGAKIVAVADPDGRRAHEVAAVCGVSRIYPDHTAMIKDGDIDAAVVSVPTFLHATVGGDILRAGLHMFLEKPPARSLAEVVAMRDASRAAGVSVTIGYQRRHDPRHIEARRRVGQGELGKIYYAKAAWINSRFNPNQARHCYLWSGRGAAMASLGSHYLDFCWWMMGEPRPLKAVAWAHRDFCASVAPEDPGDDLMSGMVWFERDCVMQVEAARQLQRPPLAFGEVYGETGSYDHRGVFTRISPDGTAVEEVLPREEGLEWDIHDRHQMANFIRRVSGENASGMDIDSAIVIQCVIDALYESAESGRAVEIVPVR